MNICKLGILVALSLPLLVQETSAFRGAGRPGVGGVGVGRGVGVVGRPVVREGLAERAYDQEWYSSEAELDEY